MHSGTQIDLIIERDKTTFKRVRREVVSLTILKEKDSFSGPGVIVQEVKKQRKSVDFPC